MLRKISIISITIILFLHSPANISFAAERIVPKESGTDSKIVLEYEFAQPTLSQRDHKDLVTIEGLQAYHNTAQPIIPVLPASILIPLGKRVSGLEAIPLDIVELKGTYSLPPAQEAYPRSYTGPRESTAPDPVIYGMSTPWPGTYGRKISTQFKRGYQLLLVNLFPVQYAPKLGRVSYARTIRLEIELAGARDVPVVRPTSRVKAFLSKRVDNPSALDSYTEARIEAVETLRIQKAKPTPLERWERQNSILQDLQSKMEGRANDQELRKQTSKKGHFKFLAASQGSTFAVDFAQAGKSAQAQDIASAFLEQTRDLFVDRNEAVEFVVKKLSSSGSEGKKRTFVRYKQMYGGLEVFGAEIIVQVNDQTGVACVMSDIMQNTELLDTGEVQRDPNISLSYAQEIALDFIEEKYGVRPYDVSATDLMIYDPAVVGTEGATALVWYMIVTSTGSSNVKEVVLVDAHAGQVCFNHSMINYNMDRTIKDFSANPDVWRCEGQQPTIDNCQGSAASEYDNEIDWAYDFAGDAYDYFWGVHGWDSYDGQGSSIEVRINRGQTQWIGYIDLADGVAQQESTGHEYTHGVTNNIVGWDDQCGAETDAIKETLSDMWAEWIDQTYDYDAHENYDFPAADADFSVVCWVKRNTDGKTEYLLDKRDAVNDGWSLLLNQDNTVTFKLNDKNITSSSTVTSDGSWHFIAVVVDRDNAGVIYIDGTTAEGATAVNVAMDIESANLHIGRTSFDGGSGHTFFNGKIDNVIIFKKNLSSAEITDLWNSGDGTEDIPISASVECIAHWKMNDEDDALAVLDSSGHWNNGLAQQDTDTLHVSGKISGALQFNGLDDYIVFDTDNDSAAIEWVLWEDWYEGTGYVWPWRRMDDPTLCKTDISYWTRSGGSSGEYPDLPQPDRYFSPYYYDNTDYSLYYSHHNLGVGNKLAYLLTEGDTFEYDYEGNHYVYDIDGMGIPKTSKLFFESLNLLPSSADYQDFGNALVQAAINLKEEQILYDRNVQNVAKACEAVQIRPIPPLRDSECIYYGKPEDATAYDYVIITSQSLAQTQEDPNFRTLCDTKYYKGLSACIVDTNWIDDNYDGTKPAGGEDLQTKIRNFLIDAYLSWGTEYCLLAGADSIVPARIFHVVIKGSESRDPASDVYYSCLDLNCTFDDDANGTYGEPNDGPGGAEVDLASEIYVGRACVETTTDVQNFVRKTLAYEESQDNYLNYFGALSVTLSLSRDDWRLPDSVSWMKPYAEYIRGRSDYHAPGEDPEYRVGFRTRAVPNSRIFDVYQHFYDYDYYFGDPPDYEDPPGDFWNPWETLLYLLNGTNGYTTPQILYYAGHGDVRDIHRLVPPYVYLLEVDSPEDRAPDLDNLTNGDYDRYFFWYLDCCSTGKFISDDCLAEELTVREDGAFAVIASTEGINATADFYFPETKIACETFDSMLDDADVPPLGCALQHARENTIQLEVSNSDGVARLSYYEMTLFGDPELRLRLLTFPMEHPDYQEWVSVDSPDSWVHPRQCHGDADGLEEDNGEGRFYVGQNDLDILNAGWHKSNDDDYFRYWIAADFDHAEEGDPKSGYHRVSSGDLNILITYWMLPDEQVPNDCVYCFPSDHPDYAEWVLMGRPTSWCYPRQCHGDADGMHEADGEDQVAVGQNDLDILNEGWKKKYEDDPYYFHFWIAADFDHAEEGDPKTGYHRVHSSDLNVLITYWKQPDANVPEDCLETE